MKLERITEIETDDIRIGDRVHVSHYTATCQETTPNVALFLLDQYLDKPWRDVEMFLTIVRLAGSITIGIVLNLLVNHLKV